MPAPAPAAERHFATGFRLRGKVRFLIWIGAQIDTVLVDAQRRVPCFESEQALRAYAARAGIAIVDEAAIEFDLDKAAAWLAAPDPRAVPIDRLLEAWNLFGDVSISIGGDFDPDEDASSSVYHRLFYGSETANTVMRPADEPRFMPRWKPAEIALLRDTLAHGLRMFEAALAPAR